MIKIKKYQIEDYISDSTQGSLDLKADLVDGKVPASQLPSFVDDVIEVANYASLPITGQTSAIYITLDNNKVYRWSGSIYIEIASGVTNLSYTPGVSNGVVNSDTGTGATIPLAGTTNAGLFSATEKSKLSGIENGANVGVVPNSLITGATKTKITYDSKGLVTSGTDATTSDVSESVNKRYVTDAQKVVIGNTSGVNTGDQGLQSVTNISANTTNSITANSFIKSGGTGDNLLKDDGTTVSLSSIGGNTNLTTSQTSTNVTINSDTGTDATIPLGNGALAGVSSNDYTTSEKNLVATIPNINTNAIDRDTVKLGESINKGQAVYVSSASGTNIVVLKASNVSEATSSKTFGLLETTGVTNDIVDVITRGLFSGLNTSTATIGDAVWLGTSGNLIFGLLNKPVAPAHLVYLGIVTRVSATVGEIFVSVQNGFELQEIHNVYLTSLANNDVLYYDSATQLWKNKQLTLQQVTNAGASTTNSISINTTNYEAQSLYVKNVNSEGIAIRGVSDDNTAIIGESISQPGVAGSSVNDNGVYGSSVNGIAVVGYSNNSIGIYGYSNNSNAGEFLSTVGGIQVTSNYDTVAIFNQSLNNKGLVINSGTSSTGNFIELVKNGVNKLVVNQAGDVTANSFVKSGGTSSQYLMADGSVTTGGSNIIISESGDNVTSSLGVVTGTLNNTIAWSRLIDRTKFNIYKSFEIKFSAAKSTIGTCTCRVYIAPDNSLTSAKLCLTATMTAANQFCNVVRNFITVSSGMAHNSLVTTTSAFVDYLASSTVGQDTYFNSTESYIIVTFQLGSISELAALKSFKLSQ